MGCTDGSCFSAPGEDVRYPPSGSFATDGDDVAYPLPPEGWEGDPFGGLFGGSGDCDVVDIMAVLNDLRDLCDSAGPLTAAPLDLELELMMARDAGGPGVYRVRGSSQEQTTAPPPDTERAEPHPEDGHHQSTPGIHDLDI
jgi:hypothetical protein